MKAMLLSGKAWRSPGAPSQAPPNLPRLRLKFFSVRPIPSPRHISRLFSLLLPRGLSHSINKDSVYVLLTSGVLHSPPHPNKNTSATSPGRVRPVTTTIRTASQSETRNEAKQNGCRIAKGPGLQYVHVRRQGWGSQGAEWFVFSLARSHAIR